jgi:hypothetical protein
MYYLQFSAMMFGWQQLLSEQTSAALRSAPVGSSKDLSRCLALQHIEIPSGYD